MDVIYLYEKYSENSKRIEELDTTIKSIADFTEWEKNMKLRARILNRCYEDNNEILECLEHYQITDYREIDSLVKEIYLQGADAEFIFPLLLKLILHYEDINDMDHLISLYHIAFSIIRRNENSDESLLESKAYLKKIIAFSKYYDRLNSKSKKSIFIAYHALALSFIDNSAISHEKSYFWFKEAEKFYNSEIVKKCIEEDEWNRRHFEFLCLEWISISKAYYDLSDDAKKEVYILSDRFYQVEKKKTNGNYYDMIPQVYTSYLNVMAGIGEFTYEEVVDKLFDYYSFNVTRSINKSDDLILNIPLELESCLKRIADRDLAIKKFYELDTIVQKTWNEYLVGKNKAYALNTYSCFITNALYFIDDYKEQENYIFNLLIKKEIPTYLHSVMVKNISNVIFKYAYEENKELFKDVDEENLALYVSNAALLHDIGKAKISNIINRHDRRLSNSEFVGIRKHPAYGAELISDSKGLQKYLDVILYHHKYYNGDGGYPKDNKNVNSKHKIIIDLITLADSLEAATDNLNRNYRNSKTADDVFTEFESGKGTKYNPDLVDLINGNEKLKEEIRNITGSYRMGLIYKAYRDGVDALQIGV